MDELEKTKRTPRLAAPKPIPRDEWTKKELERGATYPQHITPLRARIKTPEQQFVYEQLERSATQLEGELFERWPEPWQLTREQMNELAIKFRQPFLEMARTAAYLADSYRNFDVGGVIIGYQDTRSTEAGGPPRYRNGTRPNPWRVLFDANTRPATDERGLIVPRHPLRTSEISEVRKYCAELYLTDRIDPGHTEIGSPREKLTEAVAVYLAGHAQIDNDSQRTQITLTSCKLCRDRFWKKTLKVDDDGKPQRQLYSPDMVVISSDIDNLNNWKPQPIRELHSFHNELPPRSQEL